MTRHFVQFYSPETFVSETTQKTVSSWEEPIASIVAMARSVTERHGAKPYGFRFVTYERADDELDSRRVATSPMHYLGGRIETLAEIEARGDPKESLLRHNMRCNGYDRVVVNDNSWRFTGPLGADDVVHDVTL